MYGLDVEFATAVVVWLCAVGAVAWVIEWAAGRKS